MIQLKRVYKPASKTDGLRILVDRLWPRGVSKAKAKLDGWVKEIAPSDSLRKQFHHDPAKWPEFKKRYFKELESHKTEAQDLREKAKHHTITLLFGAKDEIHNNAVALKEYLET